MQSVVIAAALSLAASPAERADPVAKVDTIFAAMNKPDAPGCAVGVSHHGRVVIQRAYGSAELEQRVPLTISTILEAGSVSKQFTAAAVLLLVEDGKLALGDDVRRYVPELRDYGRTITIDHLITHTSGLRDWGAVAELGGWPRGTRAHTQADAIEIVRRQRALNYAPGSEYSYTNSGYNLLTEIVKRVSGKSLAEFSRERLFVPLGMTSTSWRDNFRRTVPNRGVAYARTKTGFAQEMPFEDVYGNGGLLTTVGDLLTWNSALAGGRVGKSVAERLQQPSVLTDGTPITYARGLFIERYGDITAIAHSGATGGYRSWMARFPGQQLSVALLCNRSDAQATRLGWQVAGLLLPADKPTAALPPYAGPDRSGLFVNGRTGRSLRIAIDKGRLTLDGDTILAAVGPDRFRDEEGDILFLNPDHFRATDGQGQSTDYRRAAPVSPSAAQLGAYAGGYASDEADVTYRVIADGAGLRLQLDRRPHITMALKPTYSDTFENEDMVVRFRRDGAGQVRALSIGIPRVRDLVFTRIPQRPTP